VHFATALIMADRYRGRRDQVALVGFRSGGFHRDRRAGARAGGRAVPLMPLEGP
jgi:hypothetical protein